jgi:hypothetical protein
VNITLTEEGQKDTRYGEFFWVNWPTLVFNMISLVVRVLLAIVLGWFFDRVGFAVLIILLLEVHYQLKVKITNQAG